MLTNCLAACTHLSSTVPSYSNCKCKKITVFTYHSPHFCFPWRRHYDYHAICCMDGKTIQCLPNPRSMYLSVFNSFRVIWCLNQCVSPKIAIFTTFLFPLGTPLGQSRMLYGWKENSMLTNCLAACALLTISVFEIEQDICEKIVILSYRLAFDAPLGGFPSQYQHPLWYGKTRMVSLSDGEKNFKDMFIRFAMIHERDGRTDRHRITAYIAR